MAPVSILILLLGSIALAAGDDEPKSESDLRRALFQNYDKLVRPVKATADKVSVRVNIIPVAVRDVDQDKRTVKLDTWLFASWEDQYLHWDPSEYGGLKDLRLPANEIWRPDLALFSSPPDHSLPQVLTNVVLHHNGTVVWVPPFAFKSHCLIGHDANETDAFHCRVILGSWTYSADLLDMQEYVHDSISQNEAEYFFNDHPKWVLESMLASHRQKKFQCCDEHYTEVFFDMHFKKRSAHHGKDHKDDDHNDDHKDDHKEDHKDDHHSGHHGGHGSGQHGGHDVHGSGDHGSD